MIFIHIDNKSLLQNIYIFSLVKQELLIKLGFTYRINDFPTISFMNNYKNKNKLIRTCRMERVDILLENDNVSMSILNASHLQLLPIPSHRLILLTVIEKMQAEIYTTNYNNQSLGFLINKFFLKINFQTHMF